MIGGIWQPVWEKVLATGQKNKVSPDKSNFWEKFKPMLCLWSIYFFKKSFHTLDFFIISQTNRQVSGAFRIMMLHYISAHKSR